MNVECQTIRVPTGVQDYRPALYGGIAAIELARRRHRTAWRSTSIPRASSSASSWLYTGAPRNSGTNNWDIFKRHIDGDRHIFDCFERIRDTARRHARRARSGGDWTKSAGRSRSSGTTENALAPGVTRRQIEDADRAGDAPPARPPRKCAVAGGGGCLFSLRSAETATP